MRSTYFLFHFWGFVIHFSVHLLCFFYVTPLFLIVFKYYSYCTGLDSGNEDVKDYNDYIEDYYNFNKIETNAKEDEREKGYSQEKGEGDKEAETDEDEARGH